MENPIQHALRSKRCPVSSCSPTTTFCDGLPPPVHPLSPRVQASACKCLSRLSWERESFALEPQGSLRYMKEKCSIQQLSGSHILPASSCLDLWPRSKVLNEGGTPTSLFKLPGRGIPSSLSLSFSVPLQSRNPEGILPCSSESTCPSSYLQGSWYSSAVNMIPKHIT